jgi:hypothetical protein
MAACKYILRIYKVTQVAGKLHRKNTLYTDYLMLLYFFRWLAVVSWGLSTLSNNTALLITLLYWSFEFQGGEVTFLDFFHHAFQVNFSFKKSYNFSFFGSVSQRKKTERRKADSCSTFASGEETENIKY